MYYNEDTAIDWWVSRPRRARLSTDRYLDCADCCCCITSDVSPDTTDNSGSHSLACDCDLRQGGYVLSGVCLSDCLSVSNFTLKLLLLSSWRCHHRRIIGREDTTQMLEVIFVSIWIWEFVNDASTLQQKALFTIAPDTPICCRGQQRPGEVRQTWICIAPCREHTSKALRYGTRSQWISQFYLHTTRSSAIWAIPAFAFSRSWSHLPTPEGWKAELALGDWLVTYRAIYSWWRDFLSWYRNSL